MQKFSIVPQRERVAVWSIAPEGAQSAVIDIDSAKQVRMVRHALHERGEKIPREFLGELRHIPVVVSLHPALAFTAILPFTLAITGNARDDRLNFQGILREYVNRGNLETRLEAAKALGVEDLDAVLFDARVMSLKLDGKPVSGWPHLQGKKLEGELHLLFTTRGIFQELHDVLHSRTELFVTSEGKAALTLLERHVKGPIRLLDADPKRSNLLVLDRKHAPVFRTLPFEWTSPLTLLGGEWQLSESAARRILSDDGPLSPSVQKLLLKIKESSEEMFRRALLKTKFRGAIYFRGQDVLPFALPHVITSAEIIQYPFVELWHSLGFASMSEFSYRDQAILLPFLEFHYHRGDPAHHRALARQIHWIAP
jgi:hypothetical protein